MRKLRSPWARQASRPLRRRSTRRSGPSGEDSRRPAEMGESLSCRGRVARPLPKPDQSLYPPERIPPGQFVTEKFPVLHAGKVPKFDPQTWDFQAYGAVEKPIKIDYATLRGKPATEVTVDIHCVTTWSKLDTTWVGWATKDLIAEIVPKRDAKFVVAECVERFTVTVHIE